ncbi:MAG: hypothetical protein ACYC8T_35055 [Myxococcaceae bacterium]
MGRVAFIVGLLLAWPAFGHESRMDKCGCHNQYGLRHCHPSKRTKRCIAPVKGKTEAPPPQRKPVPKV